MRIVPPFLLAGLGSLAFAGAVAAATPVHSLNIQLPDGTVEQIQYSGNIAPQVSYLPGPFPIASVAPLFWGFGPNSPFAAMERIPAEMNREAAVMLREAATMPGPHQIMRIDENLPPGAKSFSFTATVSPGGVCSHSMVIIGQGPDKKPRVMTRSSGDCGAPWGGMAVPDEAPAAAEPGGEVPQLQQVKAGKATPAFIGPTQVAWRTRQ
jgi:hypothetical protein